MGQHAWSPCYTEKVNDNERPIYLFLWNYSVTVIQYTVIKCKKNSCLYCDHAASICKSARDNSLRLDFVLKDALQRKTSEQSSACYFCDMKYSSYHKEDRGVLCLASEL